jgi:hypothetical protein
MPALSLQRCLQHPTREAVARCPECGRFFCRECITEHEDRLICATCLQRLSGPAAAPRSSRRWIAYAGPIAFAFTSVIVAWFSFYMLGRFLLTLPSEFHTDFWKRNYFQMDDD